MKGYRLKIMLKNSKPSVWWRVWVSGGMTFSALSVVLDTVIGSDAIQPFEFSIYQKIRIWEPTDENPTYTDWSYSAGDASGMYINELFDDASTVYYKTGDTSYKIEIENTCENYPHDFPHPEKVKYVAGSLDEKEFLARVMDGIRFQKIEQPCYLTRQEILKRKENGTLQIPVTEHPADRDDVISPSKRLVFKALTDRIANLEEEISRLSREVDANKTYHLEEILSWYDTEELEELAEEYHNLKLSGKTEDEMAKELSELLLDERRLQMAFLRLDEEELAALKLACDHTGYYEVAEEEERFESLVEFGYAFHDIENRIYIPEEVRRAFQNLDQNTFQLTREKVNWIRDCLNKIVPPYYSEIPLSRFCRLCRRSDNPPIQPEEVPDLLELIPEIDRECVLSEELIMTKQMIRDEEARDYVRDVQKGKPYYIMRQREIEDLLKYGYPAREPNHVRMRKFFQTRMGQSEERAGKLVERIHRFIAFTYQMQRIMDYLEEEKMAPPDKYLDEFLQLYQSMSNSTPTFYNRGYAPNQMGR